MALAIAPDTEKDQAVARVMLAAAEHARSFATVSTQSGRVFFVVTKNHGNFSRHETVVIKRERLAEELETWARETYKHYGLDCTEISAEMSFNALVICHELWELVNVTEPDILELLLDWACQ